MKIKTRFAPSPTGFLHVGSARTALFNWLFARHHKGTFLLRIEDTDKERSKKEFEEEILESLKWLGMDWDGPVLHQMERLDVYRGHADRLVKAGLAYAEGEALRFRSPREPIEWDDIIRGRIEFDGKLFDDLVLMKSDGTPTYNFAVVVDDGEMAISHVIRGEDHISNTPKQIPLYGALGFSMPKFAHIPLILGTDRSRLSKRHGATSIRDFRAAGYLAEAMVNYLALLGWSPGNNQEIIGREEMVQKFELERVLSTGAIFSKEKMDWMNGEYLRKMPEGELAALFEKSLRDAGVLKGAVSPDWMRKFTDLYKLRVFLLNDLPAQSGFFFNDEVEWGVEEDKNLRKQEGLAEVFAKYADTLEALSEFDHAAVEKASRGLMEELKMSGKQFIHPARMAVTGRSVSPGFFETVSLLGKERAVRRLRQAAGRLRSSVPR